jgi:hypothetical protein
MVGGQGSHHAALFPEPGQLKAFSPNGWITVNSEPAFVVWTLKDGNIVWVQDRVTFKGTITVLANTFRSLHNLNSATASSARRSISFTSTA